MDLELEEAKLDFLSRNAGKLAIDAAAADDGDEVTEKLYKWISHQMERQLLIVKGMLLDAEKYKGAKG